MLLTQQLSLNASKDGNRAALRYLGKEIRYADLKTMVSRLSYLMIREIGHNARVGFMTRNCTAVATTFLALTNTRSVTIPIDPDRPPAEIAEWLRASKATHLAVTSDLLPAAREMLSQERLHLPIVEIERKQGGEYDTSFTPPPDHVPQENDPIILFRTGGSTGKPKFVSMNHKQLQHAATCLRGPYHVTPNDRITTQMNWAHPFAFVHGMLFPLMVGATCVIDHGLEGAELLKHLADSKVTRIAGTPPLFLKLLLACRNAQRGLPGIRSVTVGMGILPVELRNAFGALRVPVAHCYGQTEAGWTICMEDTQEQTETAPAAGSVGKALVGFKYKVLDPQGDEIEGRGERQGLFAVMSPSLMTGYLGLEKETKNVLRGTWLYTGDYVRLEGEGETLRIYYIGRRDELIHLHQLQKVIQANPVDLVLKQLKGVQDGAGFPLKDTRGRDIMACAVVRPLGSTLNEKQILDHCATRLPAEQAPKLVVFTDFIPRDAGGNVNRLRLKAMFSGTAG